MNALSCQESVILVGRVADQKNAALEDADAEARRVLKTTWMGSVRTAAKVGGWAVLPYLGVWAVTKPWLPAESFYAVVGFWMLTIVIAFAVVELERLAEHARALRDVMSSKKVYEDLLREANRERDDAKDQLEQLKTDLRARVAVEQQARIVLAEGEDAAAVERRGKGTKR